MIVKKKMLVMMMEKNRNICDSHTNHNSNHNHNEKGNSHNNGYLHHVHNGKVTDSFRFHDRNTVAD